MSNFLFINLEKGSIKSPGYPSPYTPGVTCTWIIEAPSTEVIQISFGSVDIKCGFDSVTIYDGLWSYKISIFINQKYKLVRLRKLILNKVTFSKTEDAAQLGDSICGNNSPPSVGWPRFVYDTYLFLYILNLNHKLDIPYKSQENHKKYFLETLD